MYSSPHLQVVNGQAANAMAGDLHAALASTEISIRRELPRLPIADRQIEFLAFVAHELRNPLAPIRTAAALLTSGRPEGLTRAQHVIERQVDHLARMIDDLLDMARSRTGKLVLVRSRLELADVVEQAVSSCRPALSRRGQHLEVSGLAGGCPLHADAMRLIQIVTNLVDNASKFSGDGTTVRLVVRRFDRTVELVVSDDGMGMDAVTLANAFNPFAQACHATGFNKTGLGIGLAVIRQLTESHGGQVSAESAGIGLGSRFVVTLPLIADHAS
jgi:signal transduction histidine kinase